MSPLCWNERWSITYLRARPWGSWAWGPVFFLAAPRFEADDERAARGALRSLVRVPHVLPAQLIYDIVLVLYAPAHVQRLEDRHFFFEGTSSCFYFKRKKSTFFPLFFAFSRSH